ncbi:MAG: outer membrane protein assembly factor BamB [Proteobacteria bacterium]|nr:outer membrane protein assembly factor BamB [Pseudomonadota bacterium]
MLIRHKKLIIASFCLLTQACSKIDDYMLGKDNTPTPKALTEINNPKVKVANKWSLPIGRSQKGNTNFKLKPEIVGSTIYTAESSGFIQAVNKNKAELIWSKKLDKGIVSGPTVAQGVIAVSTDSSTVVLLNQKNGEVLWEAKVSGEVLAKPVIATNKVLAKTIDGNLYAFSLKEGKKLWLSEHGAPSLILKASSSPVIVDNKLALVGYSDGKMDAVDIQTGRLIWQRNIAYAKGASDVERLIDIDADPIVRGNLVFLGSYQGSIGALSLSDGQFVWSKNASTYRNMAIDSKALYVTDSDDIVWAFNRQNGQVLWKQPGLKARNLTEPTLLGNRLVIGDKTGLIHILDSNNGELLSRSSVGGAISIAPAVVGNNIFVLSDNGKLNRLTVS